MTELGKNDTVKEILTHNESFWHSKKEAKNDIALDNIMFFN